MEENKKKNGFTLIEILFSLSIALTILFSMTSILSLTRAKTSIITMDANIEIGIKVLSQDLYVGYDFHYGDTLSYRDSTGGRNTISLHKHRIVREPGFVIYMHDVEDVYFYKVGNGVYMDVYESGNKKSFLIGSDRQ